MNKGFTVPSQITSIKPLVDRGMSITFHTKELPPEEQVEVIKYLSGVGHLLFRENEVQEEEIPQEDAEYEVKTPSQRLRASLYVLHLQRGGKKEDFPDFYRKTMEKFISSIQQKLE